MEKDLVEKKGIIKVNEGQCGISSLCEVEELALKYEKLIRLIFPMIVTIFLNVQ